MNQKWTKLLQLKQEHYLDNGTTASLPPWWTRTAWKSMAQSMTVWAWMSTTKYVTRWTFNRAMLTILSIRKKEFEVKRVITAWLLSVYGEHLTNKGRKGCLCSRKCSKQKVQQFQIVSNEKSSYFLTFLSLQSPSLLLQSVSWRTCMSIFVSIRICHCLQTFRKRFCLM